MTDVGDDAPTFTASLVTDEIEPFDLSDRLGDEPVVLAFFPAAFSNTCTDEMEALRDGFERDDCTLFGVSTDLPTRWPPTGTSTTSRSRSSATRLTARSRRTTRSSRSSTTASTRSRAARSS